MYIVGGVIFLVCLSSAQEECGSDTVQCIDNSIPPLKTILTGTSDHYYIGGLFDVHDKGTDAYDCGDNINVQGLQNMEAFFWAIRYYKQNLSFKQKNGQAVNNRVDVGGVVFDNCGRKEQVIDNIMGFEQCRTKPPGVDRRQLLAFVGPERNTEATAAADLLLDMKITSVSNAATSEQLGDARKYPYFLRTVPSVKNDVMILSGILKSVLRTKYVQAVYQDSVDGKDALKSFELHANYAGICIIQRIAANGDYKDVIEKLMKNSTVHYVVVFGDSDTVRNLLKAAQADYSPSGVRRSAKDVLIFFVTSSWGRDPDVIRQAADAAENSIVVSRKVPEIFKPEVDAFTKHWRGLMPNDSSSFSKDLFVQYWEKKWGCKTTGNKTCDLNSQSLKTSKINEFVPYTIIAVRAVMQGVFDAATSACTGTYELCTYLMNIRNRGPSLFSGIKHFKAANDEFYFNTKVSGTSYVTGDVADNFTKYEVYTVVRGQYVKLADWQPGKHLTLGDLGRNFNIDKYGKTECPSPCSQCSAFQTTTSAPSTAATTQAVTASTTPDTTQAGNYSFIKFPVGQEITGSYPITFVERTPEENMTRFEVGQRWIIALGVLAGLGVLAVIVFEIYILYRLLGTRMGHRWRTMWLGQLLLFGIFLCYMTLFAYIFVPTKATCGITRFGVGVSYAFCFAVLLVKLMVILTSKSSSLSLLPGDVDSQNNLKGVYQFLMFMFAVGIQVVIDAQWLISVPPDAVRVTSNNNTKVWICNHYTWAVKDGYSDMKTFVRNEFENHLLSLIYVMFLILVITLLSFKAHGIATNHRESVFIGIAAGFSIPVWLAWTLVGGLNKNHKNAHEFCDGCIAFGLFVTATCILFIMFVPKVRQLVNMSQESLYMEDDRDTYYAGSVIMAPPSYKSRPNSVIYVNNQGIYSEPVAVGDPLATRLRHPGSTYSTTNPHLYKKAQSEYATSGRVLRMNPDLTGRYSERRRTQSEMAYGTRSAKGTLRRTHYGSQQNLGAL